MYMVVFGLVLTALLLKVGWGRAATLADLGAMSPQWILACQQSQPASSV